MRCESPMKILEILRLSEMGYPQTKIKESANCARSTVGEVLKRCREANLTFEKAQNMTTEEITALLYPAAAKKYAKQEPNYEYIYNQIKKHPNLNLRFLWTEYKEEAPGGLEYSQFCERFNRWQNKTGKHVTMHQEREPGKDMYVDWMGDKLPAVVNPETGEVHEAHFFVAALGNSGYPYAEAFPDEKLDKWLLAHTHALQYYQGIPRIVTPDNCKAAITKPQYYDPVLNPTYWEWAKHYEIAVIPARVREPQDKPVVEESVGWLETWLLGWLRNQLFFSFEELNKAILERLQTLCQQPYRKRTGSRLSIFLEVDRPALRPLPAAPFELADIKVRIVPDNYHVEYDGFYYSVFYTYYRQQVTIRATLTTIEIFNNNRERITAHCRRYTGSRYVTIPEHMPEHHRKYWEFKQFNGIRYRDWAAKIGENAAYVIDKMLTAQSVEEQAYKSCMGVLQLSKKYSEERLESACAKARSINSFSFTTISNILKNGQDLIPPVPPARKALPAHENVRGNKYYH
ncbi:integrase core domain protein [Peptococcaceae bacterium CEB3]|nr:integrase core domain protein [Peptococcaceae bacterium CEB3]